MSNFSERLKMLRKYKNLTQGQLAEELGISRSSLGMYETGRREPDFETEESMADFFNVTISYLRGKENSIQCPICHQSYNPLSELQTNEHEVFHESFMMAERKFGKMLPYGEADARRSTSISSFRNPSFSHEKRMLAYEDYLKYSFMLDIWNSNFDINHEKFEEFAKNETINLRPDELISEELCNEIRTKYGLSEYRANADTLNSLYNKGEVILVSEYRKLNTVGKNKLISTAREMNCNPLYNDNYQIELAAAHARTDGEYSEEDAQHDLDIMTDENF